MSRNSVDRPLPPMEVKMSHRDPEVRDEAVKNLHQVPLAMAKVKTGAAISAAIGETPRKVYGHEGLVSGVCSGEKVPEYLARIVADKPARQRLALALLEDDSDVLITTNISIRHGKVG